MNNLTIIPQTEQTLRLKRLRNMLQSYAADQLFPIESTAILVADNAMLYYLTGRVFNGWGLIWADDARPAVWFVRRPVGLEGENVIAVRKPEEIPAHIHKVGMPMPEHLGLEMNNLIFSTISRLMAVFPEGKYFNCSHVESLTRAVKTPAQIELMERSGKIQTDVYRQIPSLYTEGMTDFELDVAIEYLSRLHGCLGQFRIAGDTMEFFMGNILTGENADAPSPYDFALGGAGMDASLPVGATGETIRPGTTVSVDVNGNYTGHMTDMTRVFTCGDVPQLAIDAHQCSIEIHREFRRMALPGVAASALYDMAARKAEEAGLTKYFMGHRQHASFCGHGVGIEINELPVIAPRSRDILELHNAIAFEPKFVIPHVGAVGIENTYIVEETAARCITNAPEELLPLM